MEMKKQLKKQDKVVTHNLLESFSFIPDDRTIISDLQYAYNVEWGRKAGSQRPPREPIIRWMMAKLGKQRKEAEREARHIVEKIHTDGIEMTRFTRLAVDDYMEKNK